MSRRCPSPSSRMRGTLGAYILLLYLPAPAAVRTARRRFPGLDAGFYLYVGSALGLGGLEQRVSRHLRKEKRRRWHIDYLLDVAHVRWVWLAPSADRLECLIARSLAGRFEAVPGFGATDCNCRSHLFRCR